MPDRALPGAGSQAFAGESGKAAYNPSGFDTRPLALRLLPLVLTLTFLLLPAASLVASTGQAVVHPDWTARHWSVEDGLPVNSINAMIRDGEGYLWLATMDGLVRFDGAQFEVFDTLNSPGLAGNRLMVLARDTRDGLWMTTEDMRLVHFDRGRFRTLGRDDGLPHEQVTALEVIGRDAWAGTRKGAARWSADGFEALPEDLWSQPTTAIFGHQDGTVWFGSEFGQVLRLAPDGSGRKAAVPGRVWQIVPNRRGGVWIAHGSGLASWDGNGSPVASAGVNFGVQRLEPVGQALFLAGAEQVFRLDQGELTALAGQVRGSGRERLAGIGGTAHWINTDAGLMRDGELVFEPRFPVTNWLTDKGGGLLVATAGAGLFRLAPNAFGRLAGPEALLEAPVYPIVSAPDGGVWFGTAGQGAYRIGPGQAHASAIAAGSAPAVVYTLLADGVRDGWIGGLGLWRLKQGRVFQEQIPDTLRGAAVRALFRDRHARIWAGTEHDGLWRRDDAGWQRLTMPTGLENASVRVMAEGGEFIWLGTNGHGLLRFNERHGFEVVQASRPGRLIRALHVDEHRRLLIGTEDRGLCRLDRPGEPLQQDEVRCLDRRNGLPHDGIHQILPDAASNLWMSTNRGIFSVPARQLDAAFDHGRLYAAMLTEADGLPEREANGGVQSAGAVDAGGRLWFPTMRGPVSLDTARLAPAASPPAAALERMISPEGPVPIGAPPVELPKGVRSLTLGYGAADFSSGPALQFETRLIGLDSDWHFVGSRREVDFTNLPRGAFRFEVRARAPDGRVGPAAGMDLLVPPLPHETPAFRVGLVLLVLGMAFLGWRWRERRLVQDRARLKHLVDVRTQALSESMAEAERSRDRIARQAERLERLDHEKRSFFANISHELRTPLTLLLGPLEQGKSDPQAVVDQLPMMHRNARRLNRLVEQILDLQRIESGQLNVEPELHDLAAWTRSTAGLFEPLARSCRIAFEIEEPRTGVLAWFDAGQMEKVLGNLLSNAIKYCRPGDRVQVSAACQGETALLTVEDTGPGIAEAHLGRLFDRFYRAIPSDSPIEGTGIGLALARELVLLHGGELTVESAPDEGARFCLRWPARATAGRLLPIADPDAPATAPPDADARTASLAPDAGKDAACILVVDDNADLRQWLRHVLGERFLVEEAGDGAAALERMRSRLPDLVVSDWMMPVMDGIELVERMGQDVQLQGVPVILLSARAEMRDHVQGLGAGAVAYVRKPFNAAMLEAQIESLLKLGLRLRRDQESRPGRPHPAPGESAWMGRVRAIVAARLHDPAFGVEALAGALAIGRTGLFRKMKDECGQSPSALLREARLMRAAELLDQRAGNVSEVAYAVGFDSLEGFTRAYATRFGQRPSERLGRGKAPGNSQVRDRSPDRKFGL